MNAAIADSAIVVTSGETSDENEALSLHPQEQQESLLTAATKNNNNDTDLHDAHADEQDANYVYQKLRSGDATHIQVDTVTSSVKRSSDAVLACPACFNIVCMDCQQHDRYKDQFRAMYVMGITVKWDEKLVYDRESKGLIPLVESEKSSGGGGGDFYYSVACANCDAFVAALDIEDEVYHFEGCLASPP